MTAEELEKQMAQLQGELAKERERSQRLEAQRQLDSEAATKTANDAAKRAADELAARDKLVADAQSQLRRTRVLAALAAAGLQGGERLVGLIPAEATDDAAIVAAVVKLAEEIPGLRKQTASPPAPPTPPPPPGGGTPPPGEPPANPELAMARSIRDRLVAVQEPGRVINNDATWAWATGPGDKRLTAEMLRNMRGTPQGGAQGGGR